MTILDEIIANKRQEVQQAKARLSQNELEAMCQKLNENSFWNNMKNAATPRIIAECKKKSPSKGVICSEYDPVKIAKTYEQGSAAAISVLTDEKYFGGCASDLEKVCKEVKIPVIRKDFIIDIYQIYEARKWGASSYLLLSGVLDKDELKDFISAGRELNMEPLVESHTNEQFEQALEAGAKILGVNNRNLKNFDVDLNHAKNIIKNRASEDLVFVCESGIKSIESLREMMSAGYQAFLIGEYLMRAPSATLLLKQMHEA